MRPGLVHLARVTTAELSKLRTLPAVGLTVAATVVAGGSVAALAASSAVTGGAPRDPVGAVTEVVRFVQALRTMGLNKPPGVAETLDWARALVALHRDELDEETVQATLGCVIKDVEDVERLGGGELERVLAAVRRG